MTEPDTPEYEALLAEEVERAVAPYVGVAPPFMVAKLRELAERYYREHPQAAQILRMRAQSGRLRSGTEPVDPRAAATPTPTAKGTPKKGRR